MLTMTLPGSPSTPNLSGATTPVPGTPGTTIPSRPHGSKARFRKSWGSKNTNYSFDASNDIIGIVMLEIKGATDLPKLKNSECSRL